MKGRYTQHSKVMTIANNLVKQGYSRVYAMVKAWALVKLSPVTVKVAGVTYGKRQTAIEHLMHYRPQDVRISLCRDKDNAADKNRRGDCRCTGQRSVYNGLSPQSVRGVHRSADGQRQANIQPLVVDLRRSGALSQLWNENRGEGIEKTLPGAANIGNGADEHITQIVGNFGRNKHRKEVTK